MSRFAFVVALLLPNVALAHDYAVGDMTIAHPVARPTAATAMAGAGYMSVTNNGTTADRLIAVEADFPRVMLHDTVMDGDVARMDHKSGVEIAPGAGVAFEPGGLHVMFMGLNGDPFEIGESVPATLVFENAGRVEIVFKVEEIAAPEGDHSDH